MRRLPSIVRSLTFAFATVLALGRLAAEVAAPDPAGAGDKSSRGSDEGTGLINLGTSLSDRGDYASAETAFRKILDEKAFSKAEKASALLGLARAYRRAGESTKAVASYESFAKDFPADERQPDALLELGRTLRSIGAYKMALNRFYSVINSTLKLPQKGFDHYQALARTAEYEIAETYVETGDYVQSGRYFARLQLLDLSPSDRARASFMAAQSQLLSGDSQTAVKSLFAFLEAWPGDENAAEARYLLATTLRKLNRSQEALMVALDLLKKEKSADANQPQKWSYWQRRTGNLLANDFFQSGDTPSALSIYQGMLGLGAEPEWQLPLLYQIALCEERLFDFPKAAETYHKIVDGAEGLKSSQTSEIGELAQMSKWRLNHIEWLQTTESKIASLSDAPEPPHAARPKEVAAVAPNPPSP
ncbi:MAG TPA: tetratricopeptide repeat protein [Opitutaceae bacterium]|jgi:tetratricopeptide (TPR) repeat protein